MLGFLTFTLVRIYKMINIKYKYGHQIKEINLQGNFEIDTIVPNQIQTPDLFLQKKDIFKILNNFLTKLHKDISEIRVGIAVNDKSRPVPYYKLLPPLMDTLKELGISNSSIVFFVANGTHEQDSESLSSYFVKDYLGDYSFHQHNCLDQDNLLDLGSTTRNTPILINKEFYNCDLKIAIGNIEPHHFAGFSGGYKTVAIGLAGKQTITANHKLLLEPGSTPANFVNNPLRQDIEEIGKKSGLHFCLNCIMNKDKSIVSIFFDTPSRVMEFGIPIVKSMYAVNMKCKYDIVIVSAGGYPKDINLYQAQKALTNASQICAKNGTILLLAECTEKIGNVAFEEYMQQFLNYIDVIKDFTNAPFQLGRHKAYLIAKVLANHHIAIHSSINPKIIERLLLEPVPEPELYLNNLVKPESTIAFIPEGVITIPICHE